MTPGELRDIESRQTVAAMYQTHLPPLVQRIIGEDVTKLLAALREGFVWVEHEDPAPHPMQNKPCVLVPIPPKEN